MKKMFFIAYKIREQQGFGVKSSLFTGQKTTGY